MSFLVSQILAFEYRSIDSSPTPSTDQSGDLNTANSQLKIIEYFNR